MRRALHGRKSLYWLLASLTVLGFGGFLAAPADAAPTGPGTLEICKSSAHGMSGTPFHFTVNGSPLTVNGGACSGALSKAPGQYTIIEAATAGLEVQRIKANRVVSKDVAARKVVVTVKAGSTPATETLVTYTNRPLPAVGLKICKQTPDQTLVGDLFSFTKNGGPASSVAAGPLGSPNCGPVVNYQLGTNVNIQELAVAGTHVSDITVSDGRGSNVDTANRSVTATIGAGVTVVTYTNAVNIIPQKGFIEVCKYADGPYVSGSFDFTIKDALGLTIQRSILVGQCTEPLEVQAGNVSVSEAARFPYVVSGIWAAPSGRLVTSNLANGTATVTVVKGDESTETAVFFKNAARTAYIKVCKVLAANASALTDTPFSFTVQDVNGSHQVTVVSSSAAPGIACVIDPVPLPLGSNVSITEQAKDNVRNTGVNVSPASQDNGSAPPTARMKVGSGITTATFTNQAWGTIEICKNAADPSTATQTFQFSVNGGPAISVHAGGCSPAIPVPAGTTNVTELAKSNFHLTTVTAVGPAGESRLLSGTNPVTVSTPFGGVENETLVTFTNAVNTGSFKVCKRATDPGLTNVTFTFRYSYTVNGTPYTGVFYLKPGGCSAITGTIPVVDPQGNPIPITVSEDGIIGVNVDHIVVSNGNTVTSPNDHTVVFSVNQGVTTVDFYNVRAPLIIDTP